MGDDPLMTKEEGSVQLADAAWTLGGARKCLVSAETQSSRWGNRYRVAAIPSSLSNPHPKASYWRGGASACIQ